MTWGTLACTTRPQRRGSRPIPRSDRAWASGPCRGATDMSLALFYGKKRLADGVIRLIHVLARCDVFTMVLSRVVCSGGNFDFVPQRRMKIWKMERVFNI